MKLVAGPRPRLFCTALLVALLVLASGAPEAHGGITGVKARQQFAWLASGFTEGVTPKAPPFPPAMFANNNPFPFIQKTTAQLPPVSQSGIVSLAGGALGAMGGPAGKPMLSNATGMSLDQALGFTAANAVPTPLQPLPATLNLSDAAMLANANESTSVSLTVDLKAIPSPPGTNKNTTSFSVRPTPTFMQGSELPQGVLSVYVALWQLDVFVANGVDMENRPAVLAFKGVDARGQNTGAQYVVDAGFSFYQVTQNANGTETVGAHLGGVNLTSGVRNADGVIRQVKGMANINGMAAAQGRFLRLSGYLRIIGDPVVVTIERFTIPEPSGAALTACAVILGRWTPRSRNRTRLKY